ncbi:MAG: hypothetical protein M5U12_31570 [Verrucomicrobia bacterium]|nr:hypothetical protein [Verrucomicrobiota bacterium]
MLLRQALKIDGGLGQALALEFGGVELGVDEAAPELEVLLVASQSMLCREQNSLPEPGVTRFEAGVAGVWGRGVLGPPHQAEDLFVLQQPSVASDGLEFCTARREAEGVGAEQSELLLEFLIRQPRGPLRGDGHLADIALDTPLQPGRTGGLLEHMSGLVGHQSHVIRVLRGSEPDVSTHGERLGAQLPGQSPRPAVVVHANVPQADAQPGFETAAHGGCQGAPLSWGWKLVEESAGRTRSNERGAAFGPSNSR